MKPKRTNSSPGVGAAVGGGTALTQGQHPRLPQAALRFKPELSTPWPRQGIRLPAPCFLMPWEALQPGLRRSMNVDGAQRPGALSMGSGSSCTP